MPRIWLDYCQFLIDQHLITRIRRTFDRALRALPITQHYRIWPLYLKFVRSYPIPETAVRVYRRYLKVTSTEGTFVCACASRNKRVVHESRDCRGNPNIGGNFKVQFVNKLFQTYDIHICQIFTSIKTTFIHEETIWL